MRVVTTLGSHAAYQAMLLGLVGEGFQITRNVPPVIEAELVKTRRGAITVKPLIVTVTSDESGTVVTLNGRGDAYLFGRRVAKTLP